MHRVRKKFKFEMAHILDSSYSNELFTCPVCKKEKIKNIFLHCQMMKSKKHDDFIEKFDQEINEIIDYLLPNYMQLEINTELQNYLPFLTPVSIANKIRNRTKELGFNTRKVLGKRRQGKNNPVHKKGVREKISKSVANKWENGDYSDRINGMLGKTGNLHPNYNPEVHTKSHQGLNYFNSFLSGFQDIKKCARCGSVDKKINVHHIDENHENFLPSNLEPLCVPCHLSYHYPQVKKPFCTIEKTFRFPAAHQLPNHNGLCQFLHGHEWKIEIQIRKRIDFETGMVLDFSDLKRIVKKEIISKVDHSTLNERIYNPTAENILIWIWECLMFDGLLKGIKQISVWESTKSQAIITEQDMLSVFTDKKYNLKRKK